MKSSDKLLRRSKSQRRQWFRFWMKGTLTTCIKLLDMMTEHEERTFFFPGHKEDLSEAASILAKVLKYEYQYEEKR